MAHTLQLTKGARTLASQLLNIPDQFKTLADLHTALTAASVLDMEEVPPAEAQALISWVAEPSPVEVTEAQRDLLKTCCKTNASKLPINTHTLLLLTELGLAP